ncbi:hypothetical protein GCM10022217_05300 [Chryseobacterium ginsenosidimutans]|uniref:hypothetical protein n=1 Tax=Chryseobacterium ginsenosidimutans TaxID=687846 RepID=UPI0031D3384E
MKKFLLTTTMLVGFVAIAQAQQGRVGINTTTPAATLDVVGAPADATRPDALLVPRITRGQLQAKDAVYTAAQNGALAFVSSIADGAATGKAINVTAVGFYYYDGATTNTWIAFGGGAPATQRYEAIRGTAVVTSAAAYTATASDYLIETTSGAAVTITLPAATAANNGRVVVVSNQNTAASTVTVVDASATPIVGTATVLQLRGKHFISDGTRWVSISYN